MESVIKELESAYKQVANLSDLADRELRLEALNKIERFILEYDWGSSKNIQDFKKFCKLPNKEFARLTKQSENNVRLIHKRVSDKIREKLGYNKINLVLEGNREDLKKVIHCIKILEKNIRADYCIPTHILNTVSEGRVSVDYLVSDLGSEIEFLRKNSKKRINQEIKELDKDRLAYVFKVLNSNEGYLLDKKEEILRQILNNKGDAKI